jgi:hypothetical protein
MVEQLRHVVLVILLCVLAGNLSAVTCTTTGTGNINWSDPASWTGCGSGSGGVAGTPGSGDDIVHSASANLVVDVPSSIGTGTGTAISMTGGASCRMTVNAALTVNGDWLHNQSIATLQANPTVDVAANITFDAAGGRRQWRLNGAASQKVWVRVRAATITASGGDWYWGRAGNNGGYLDIDGSSVENCYDGTQYCYNLALGNSAGSFKFTNSTIANSGELGTATGVNAGAVIDLSGSVFANTRSTYAWGIPGATTTILIREAVFLHRANFANAQNITVEYCYFDKAPGISGTSTAGFVWRHNFIRKQGNTILTVPVPPLMENTYLYHDDATGTDPHNWQVSANWSTTAQDNIIESSGPVVNQGDVFDVGGGAASPRNHVLRRNLVLKSLRGDGSSGFLVGALGGANISLTIEHNTAVGNSQPVYTGDAYNPHAGFIASLRSNLFVSPDASQLWAITNRHDGGAPNNDVVTASGYNNLYGVRSGAFTGVYNPNSGTYDYALGASDGTAYLTPQTSAPNVGDLSVDPQFVDSSRRLITWAVARGYATSGQTITEKETAAYTALQADPLNAIPDLITWVRAGYAPTNAALDGTAHDGGDIGAVEAVITATRTMALPMIW